jgi:uncharacterized protein YpuA (DUF1002 family)
MKTGTKIGLVVGIAFAAMVVIIFGVAVFTFLGVAFSGKVDEQAMATRKKRTAEAVGTITSVGLYSGTKEYRYSFVANGVSQSGTWTTSRSKVENTKDTEGLKVHVCYDPADPTSSDFNFSELENYGERKGQNIICGA